RGCEQHEADEAGGLRSARAASRRAAAVSEARRIALDHRRPGGGNDSPPARRPARCLAPARLRELRLSCAPQCACRDELSRGFAAVRGGVLSDSRHGPTVLGTGPGLTRATAASRCRNAAVIERVKRSTHGEMTRQRSAYCVSADSLAGSTAFDVL